MIQRVAINNFTGGEISAWGLASRYDIAKYKTACKKIRNFICELHGSLRRRPGTFFCEDLGAQARLIPFQFSTDPNQTYALVLQDKKIRIAQGFGFVTTGTPATPVEIVTPYDEADLADITYAQSGDVIYLAHKDYVLQKLTRSSHTSWALSTVTFVPPLEAPNAVSVVCSVSGSFSLRYIVAAEDEDGKLSLGSVAGVDTTAKHPSDWVVGDHCTVRWAAVAGAERYLIHREEAGYFGLVGVYEAKNVSHTTSHRSSDTTTKTLYFEADGVEDFNVNDYIIVPSDVGGTGFAGTYKITAVDINAKTLSYTGADSTESKTAIVKDVEKALNVVRATSHRSSATTDKTLYFESDPDTVYGFAVGMTIIVPATVGGLGFSGTKTITAVDLAAKSITYVGADSTEAKTPAVVDVAYLMGPFDDVKYEADTTDTPLESNLPFDEGNNPSLVGFHEQRLVLANGALKPQTFYGSRVGDFENFCKSRPLSDSDPYEFTISSGSIDSVQWMASFGDLLLGTGGVEYKAMGGDASITPTNIKIKAQSYWGSKAMRPLIIGNSVLHVQRQGSRVRDLFFSLEKDGYAGNDLSVLAPHFFDGYDLTQWAYQQSPGSVIWVVRDDGTLLGMTYMKEHEIWGWHMHTTDGTFESVCTTTGLLEDAVWLVVKRVINGYTKYFLERMATKWQADTADIEDAMFLDCAGTYSGAPSTYITGLDRFNGDIVDALVDGSPVIGLTVAGGAVTLPYAGSKVHVGLPYTSVMIPNTPEAETQQGSTLGKIRAYGRCTARLIDTVGGQYGPDEANLYDMPSTPDNWGEAVQPKSWDEDFAPGGGFLTVASVCIAQPLPLPMTVAALMLEVDIEG